MDLALEHFIRLLKLVMKKLGANATDKKILDRYTKALPFNKMLLDNFDNMTSVIKQSGKHVKKAASEDLKKIVNELITNKAFTVVKGRHYKYFRGVKDSLLDNVDSSLLFKWIDEHKKLIKLQKAAR